VTDAPANAKPLDVAGLIDEFMAAYAGKDPAIEQRLSVWRERLGAVRLAEITDDHIFDALDRLAQEPARMWAGFDADGKPVYRRRATKKSPSTVNRYHVALSAVFSWAIRKRRVARGFENPCRKVERQREAPGVVRFLSNEERQRLLDAVRASRWPRLYLLVLLAITTGARRGELTALRWSDIDFERAEAHVPFSKNGEPKVLPLVPAVLEELQRFHGEDRERFKIGTPSMLVFHSRRRPDVVYTFEETWREALSASQVRRFRFHDLRHTCASYLAQSGASLLEIADVLGHRQLAMTKRYSHLTTGTKKALVARVLGDLR